MRRAATSGARAGPRPLGRFMAAEVGRLVGVSGTTIGQWARHGYIASSQRVTEPRVYSVEDVMEAAVVARMLERGVSHEQVRRTLAELADGSAWPLSRAPLATTADGGPPRVALRDEGAVSLLTHRGWQLSAAPPPLDELRPALQGWPAGRPRRASPPPG